MIRRIVHIDRKKCNGCGACAAACHEGAIGMVDGKAMLLREDYCDGLGDCLPACPANAISFEQREAPAYDEAAVKRAKAEVKVPSDAGGCPALAAKATEADEAESRLLQWPVQIKLMPLTAPYYACREMLIAADCTAFAYGNIHRDFMGDKVTMIGCPKLDEGDYAVKLGEILRLNDVSGVTVLRMEVPCCGGLENAARRAIMASGKMIPLKVVVITADGKVRIES